MTKLKIFNLVKKQLRVQGRRSVKPESGFCQYRSKDGARCGVGFLIPDEEYSPSMEGRTAKCLVRDTKTGLYDLPKEIFNTDNISLLTAIQQAHDSGSDGPSFVPDFEYAMARVYERFFNGDGSEKEVPIGVD